MRRRSFLASPLLLAGAALAQEYARVVPGQALEFPRDHGAHPAFRTEWWYATGWLQDARGAELGFQVTFFRNRPRIAEDNASRFAPKQLVFAHAALADPKRGRLAHDQRAARIGFGLADAREGTTDTSVDGWLVELVEGVYHCVVQAREFSFELHFAPRPPILLQGEAGYSRKGPDPRQSSYYYSRPQLMVTGTVDRGSGPEQVTGTAWLDHEWSSEVMAPEAAGWDWTGLNLAGGGALMAFRMRDRRGGVLWAGGTHRFADGRVRTFAPGDIRFEPLRRWRSPRSDVDYPVAMRVSAGDAVYDLEPLMDDQELDSRASTGTIYWEGAVRARQGVRLAGLGYLELTGYWKPLRL